MSFGISTRRNNVTNLCICLPPILLCFRLVSPLLTNDLRNVWIGKTWILSNDGSLAILAIENERYSILAHAGLVSRKGSRLLTVSRPGNLRLRLAQTKVDH